MAVEAQRIAATQRHLEQNGLDALIAFNNGQNLFLDSHAVFVFSGTRPLGESAVIIERGGKSTLIATPAWDKDRLTRLSQTDATIACDDIVTVLADALSRLHLDAKKVITTGLNTMPQGFAKRIPAMLGGEPSEEPRFAGNLARIRNADELAAAEKATWIGERGYERMLETARPGLREFELVAELNCYMKELGAEDNFLLVSASQHNLAVCAAGRRILDVGDIILSEITPCYHGQYAQLCRTTVIGEAPALLKEKYAILQEAMRRGQEAALPGMRVGDVTAKIDDCFREAGYGDYCKPPYMRVRGHGLGITSDRPGDITSDSDVVLESGMIFVMHPNQYLPETGYLMCGEPVAITPTGARALSSRTATLDSVAG